MYRSSDGVHTLYYLKDMRCLRFDIAVICLWVLIYSKYDFPGNLYDYRELSANSAGRFVMLLQ